MKRIRVNINNSTLDALREECAWLGIHVKDNAKLATIKRELRKYRSNYILWRKFTALAALLFGDDHDINTETTATIYEGISDKLYQRLMSEGFVQVGTVRGGGLHDPISGDAIYVISRTHAKHVRIVRARDGEEKSNSEATIIFVARLAFLDVNDTYRLWETDKTPAAE